MCQAAAVDDSDLELYSLIEKIFFGWMMAATAVIKWRMNVYREHLQWENADLPIMLSTILGIILIAFCYLESCVSLIESPSTYI